MAETSVDELRQQVDLIFRHLFPNGPPPTVQPTGPPNGTANTPLNEETAVSTITGAVSPDQGTSDGWGEHRPMPGHLPPAVHAAPNIGTPANPPLPDYCSRESYQQRLTLVENCAREPNPADRHMGRLQWYLEGTSAALSLHHRSMFKFLRREFRQLRPRLDALHPLAYSNFKVILETDLEDNADIRARMARIITRIERREHLGLMPGVAYQIAKDLFVQAVSHLRKTAYFTMEASEWLAVARSMQHSPL
ncbi:uncharacterized protein LOC62_02G003491 [Vanrija pseudolonga]|uniref:Uncharacterized protein n=1 Tax=Vanrija pseudolonga TaxID=143232 RepID=A0AAF0Y4L3_9TREE|nr:hypothetical protein LOC62_02G003491 [Vanrija pseudolonga]